jgi:hypothetical protein
MTDEELIGETVPTETVAFVESEQLADSELALSGDIALCSNYATPINDPFCATRRQSHGITAFKFLFLVLVYIILAALGLAVAFSVEVITQ